MTIARTRAFRSGNSQAIRLPKELAFPEGTELIVVRTGDVLTAYPVGQSIAEMVAGLTAMPRPSEIEARDTDGLPEREGL